MRERQFSAERLRRRSLKEAPLLGKGSSSGWDSAIRSVVDSWRRIRGLKFAQKSNICCKTFVLSICTIFARVNS